MSTRCNIIVRGYAGNQIILYHHHDGYPHGVGSFLRAFCEKISDEGLYMDYTDIATWLVKNGLYIIEDSGKVHHDDEYKITDRVANDAEYVYVLHAHPYGRTKNYYKVFCYDVRSWSYKRNAKIDIPPLAEQKAQVSLYYKQ